MRLLRGIGGRVLACGCLVGIYETYSGVVVATIDARSESCHEPGHTLHARLPALPDEVPAGKPRSDRAARSRF